MLEGLTLTGRRLFGSTYNRRRETNRISHITFLHGGLHAAYYIKDREGGDVRVENHLAETRELCGPIPAIATVHDAAQPAK